MIYGNIEGVSKKVSRIVCGTGNVEQGFSSELFGSIMDKALELGVNAVDTGREYADGYCEKILGEWFKKSGKREEVVYISKGGHHNDIRKRVTTFDITADIYDSLALAQTDYIDVYMMHRDDEEYPVGELVEMLNGHKEKGIIKAFGASNMTLERLKEANAYAEKHGLSKFTVTSQHFSLGEQYADPWGGGCVSATGAGQQDMRAWYKENNLPLLAYSSLCFGLFAGRFDETSYQKMVDEGTLPEGIAKAYCHEDNFKRLERVKELAAKKNVPISSLALAYVLNYDKLGGFPTYALVGIAEPKELSINVSAADIQLDTDELKYLGLKQ